MNEQNSNDLANKPYGRNFTANIRGKEVVFENGKATSECRECGKLMTINYELPRFPTEVNYWPVTMLFYHRDCRQKMQIEQDERENLEEEFRLKDKWDKICPPLYQKTVTDELPDQESYLKVLSWKYGPIGLVLKGEPGTGKTRSMFVLLKRECWSGRSIRYFRGPEFRHKAATAARSERGSLSWVRDLTRSEILFLDDLDKINFTESVEEMLFEIIEGRVSTQKPTLFTFNFSGERLLDRLSDDRGDAILRRIREFTTTVNFK